LADSLSVSRSTIERWRAGRNLPNQIIAKIAIEYIEKLIVLQRVLPAVNLEESVTCGNCR